MACVCLCAQGRCALPAYTYTECLCTAVQYVYAGLCRPRVLRIPHPPPRRLSHLPSFSTHSTNTPPPPPLIRKPCICSNGSCCFGQTFIDTNMEIPDATAAAAGLSQDELRAVIVDVGNELDRRKACCWKGCLCGPLLPVFWWIDAIARFNLSKCLCFNPASAAIQGHLNRHNELLKDRGVRITMVSEDINATSDFGEGLGALTGTGRIGGRPKLQAWVLAVISLPFATPPMETTTLHVQVQVPEGVGSGMPFQVQVGQQMVTVACPSGVAAGAMIQIEVLQIDNGPVLL